jgi:hypothetical protein
LRPRSTFVVGASGERTGFAGQYMRVILQHARPESFYLMNPRRQEIERIACHPEVESIVASVELAIITVPAAAVPDCLAYRTKCTRASAASRFSAAYTRMATTLLRFLGSPRWYKRQMIRAVLKRAGAERASTAQASTAQAGIPSAAE